MAVARQPTRAALKMAGNADVRLAFGYALEAELDAAL